MTTDKAIGILAGECDRQSASLAEGMIEHMIPQWIVVERAIRNILSNEDCQRALDFLSSEGPEDWDEGNFSALVPVIAHRYGETTGMA